MGYGSEMADLRNRVHNYVCVLLAYSLGVSCRAYMMTDCTAVGDEVVIMIMMMLSMAMMCISYDWLIVVRCMGVGLGWVRSGSTLWTHRQLCISIK